ncbi:MAG: ATP-binding cassette domain-containing protein, partial [Ruminococcus sp.]|nr:ATP-binding cassette domain-containing protein [Ruminococcus sp.]
MEAVKVKNLSFRYPETGVDVLRDVSFTVQRGEFVTLCGLSGSGKSTLLRQLKPALAPHGVRQGEIYINGNELSTLSPREQTQLIGFVQQSPDNQIVTDKV